MASHYSASIKAVPVPPRGKINNKIRYKDKRGYFFDIFRPNLGDKSIFFRLIAKVPDFFIIFAPKNVRL